jgi:hypothetical protein
MAVLARFVMVCPLLIRKVAFLSILVIELMLVLVVGCLGIATVVVLLVAVLPRAMP